MNWRSKLGLIALPFLALLPASCHKEKPNYSTIPAIEYKGIARYSDGSAQLKFNFKDGDADIGNPPDQGSNFYFTLYVKNGSNWDSVTTYGYTIMPMDGGGKYTPYEGEVDVKVYAPFAYPPVSKYKCWLFDRAGHRSNEVFTEEIVP